MSRTKSRISSKLVREFLRYRLFHLYQKSLGLADRTIDKQISAHLSWIAKTFGVESDVQIKIIKTLVVLLFSGVLRGIVIYLTARRLRDPKILCRFKTILSYIVYALSFLIVGRIWFLGFKDLSTYLGLLSAGLAVSLKDLLVNCSGLIFIVW